VVNDTIAVGLQEYLAGFVIDGAPCGPGLPNCTFYGSGAELENLNATSVIDMMGSTVMRDVYDGERLCTLDSERMWL
jgi:hypothetical protein